VRASSSWLLMFAGCLVLSGALVMLTRADQPDKGQNNKPAFYTGQVVPIKDLVEKAGSKLDADAEPTWLALVTKTGDIYPLIKDDGSRMFFKDAALLKRPMRLTGKLLPKSTLLQVLEVHSLKNGKLHEVYYWCDICSIRRFEKNICDCCGGPMVLHEDPLPER
jgi:hypothetical protein